MNSVINIQLYYTHICILNEIRINGNISTETEQKSVNVIEMLLNKCQNAKEC